MDSELRDRLKIIDDRIRLLSEQMKLSHEHAMGTAKLNVEHLRDMIAVHRGAVISCLNPEPETCEKCD